MATYRELLAQEEALKLKIAEAREAELADAIIRVIAIVSEYDLQPSDIFDGRRGRKSIAIKKKVAPKYRDKDGNEWTGRGRAPKWLDGKDKSKFLIA